MKNSSFKTKSKFEDADPKTTASQGPAARQFLTVKQLATRWQISQRQVHRIIANGDLRVHRFGRSVRVALDEIELFELRHRSHFLAAVDSP